MAVKTKILVVDDEPQMLQLLSEIMTQMGAEPHCVESGPQAAERVNREKFDGVFLDWKMPVINGIDLTKCIRQSKSNARCPIVMLTGINNLTAMQESFKAGVNFFLQKPVTIQQIRHLLNASRGMMLQERRRPQRVPIQVAVLCRWKQKAIKGQGVNLSVSGMLVTMEEVPVSGASVELEFNLPGDAKLFDMTASVARINSDHQVGLHFTNLSSDVHQRLADFVDRAAGHAPGTV